MTSFVRSIFIIGILHLLVIVIAMGLAIRRGMTEPIACEETLPLVQMLTQVFGESDIGGGQINASTIIRIFASANGQTFTIMSIATDGTACVLALGIDLEILTTPSPAPVELEN